VQKLSNLFGLYLPEDDDEDAIMAIRFPSDSKAVNYFIQVAKYQNRIRWDDRSLRKVVKDALPSCILDKLRSSHKDTSHFEGLKRVVLRIDNDYWKRHFEEKQKSNTICATFHPSPRTSGQEGRPTSTSVGSRPAYIQPTFKRGKPPTFCSLSFPPKGLTTNSATILGPDGRLTLAEH